MNGQSETPSALSPYRVLDLTHGGYMIAGKILGDLGADVIKIEPPGGDPSRNIGPFYKDVPDSEQSLFWLAYNANKRGITLDIKTSDGQEIFKRLVGSADFIVESSQPGHLESLRLGYGVLRQVNPRTILTSITPFGQGGPKARLKACDLTILAAGGHLYPSGDPDRPPNWISFPQASFHAGAEAASAALIAHWRREATGEGEWVDVSVQECVVGILMNALQFYDLNNVIVQRIGYRLHSPRLSMGLGYACKDGWVTTYVLGGSALGFVSHMQSIVQWMDEEGMAPDWLRSFDWVSEMDASKLTQERYDYIQEPFVEFFKTKTKKELFEWALKRRDVLLAPVQTSKDILEDVHLQARSFWSQVDNPKVGDSLPFCGPFAKLSETPCRIRRHAPAIGEHNNDIYVTELGMSKQQLIQLRQAGVV